MLNKVILIGVVSKPLTTKQLNSYAVGSFSVLITRTFIKNNEQQREESEIECSVFGKLIDEANKFDLGKKIMIEGRLRSTKNKNKATGAEYHWLTIVVEKITEVEFAEFNLEFNKSYGRPEDVHLSDLKQPVVTFSDDLPF